MVLWCHITCGSIFISLASVEQTDIVEVQDVAWSSGDGERVLVGNYLEMIEGFNLPACQRWNV